MKNVYRIYTSEKNGEVVSNTNFIVLIEDINKLMFFMSENHPNSTINQIEKLNIYEEMVYDVV